MKSIAGSLSGRLLLASLVLLPLFLGLTGLYLDRAHRLSVEAAQQERLQLQVLTLLAEAEYENTIWFPEKLLEARFNQTDSGLYAVVSSAGQQLWSSPSALSQQLDVEMPQLATGQRYFVRRGDLFQYSYEVVWETASGEEVPLLFTVLESAEPVMAEVSSYRRSLLLWLGGATLLLIACQALILAWGLRPLRELAADIKHIEAGNSDHLAGPYPRELQVVTDNLNTLLISEKQRRERVRNTLADLAHSLKTPLAVIRSAGANQAGYPELVAEQADRMEQIVSYQLQRAVGGSHKLLQTVRLAPVLERLRSSLLKVYADKAVDIELLIEQQCMFRGDERDLLEILGNLMDNACKYGRRRVRVSASCNGNGHLLICVEDDGEGIAQHLRREILQRGVRADTRPGGHGIGLAVAADIVATYQGKLEIGESRLGGALLRLSLP